MSLDSIGELSGKHPSTVGYWLKKHGLRAGGADRHARKGPLDKARLEALVGEGLTLEEIARRVERSVATVRYWLRRHELGTRQRRRQQPPGRPKRAKYGVRSTRDDPVRAGGSRSLPVRRLPSGGGREAEARRQADAGGGGWRRVPDLRLFAVSAGSPVSPPRSGDQGVSSRAGRRIAIAGQISSRGAEVRSPLRKLSRRGGGRIGEDAAKLLRGR